MGKQTKTWVEIVIATGVIAGLIVSVVIETGGTMTGQNPAFDHYPQQVQQSVEQPGSRYVQQAGFFAIHDATATSLPGDAIMTLNDDTIAIFAGDPQTKRDLAPGAEISPVYALQPGGSMAVPTGSVFIRFSEGTVATEQAEVIRAAGYEIVDSPIYAPHAAWVRARSGRIADALAGVAQLQTIPGMVNVEPQMVMQRGQR